MSHEPLLLHLESTDEMVRVGLSPFLIGSHARADLVVQGEGVNRRHALLLRELSGWLIHDLASTLGVWVNGRRVRAADLKPGDRIHLGGQSLVVAQPVEPAAAPPSAPVPGRVEDWLQELLGTANEDRISFSQSCHLDFFHGDKYIHSATLADTALVGSSGRADVRLPKKLAAPLHALITMDSGSWWIHDLASGLGIECDGKKARSFELHYGDELQLGAMRVVVWLEAPDSENQSTVPLKQEELASAIEITQRLGQDRTLSMESHSRRQRDPHVAVLLARAQAAVRLREYRQAIVHYKELLRDAPLETAYRRALRSAQRNAVRWRGNRRPRRLTPLIVYFQLRARWAMLRDKPFAALALLERGLDRDPWNRGLLLLQAWIFERLRRYDLCLWSLAAARRRAPGSLDPHINRPMAKLLRYLGNTQPAIELWKLVGRYDPDDVRVADQIRECMAERILREGLFRQSTLMEESTCPADPGNDMPGDTAGSAGKSEPRHES